MMGFGGDFRNQLAAATVTFHSNAEILGTASARTFSNKAFGAAHPARRLVVAVTIQDDLNTGGTLSSITIDGVTARIVHSESQGTSSTAVIAEVLQGELTDPTITTANIVITMTATNVYFFCSTYRVLSFAPASRVQVQGDTSTAVGTVTMTCTPTLNVGPNVAAIGIYGASTNDGDSAQPITWLSEMVEPHDALDGNGSGEDSESISANFAAAPGTFIQTLTFVLSGGASEHAMAVAVWPAQ